MRKLILATVSLTCVFGMAHASSFLDLGQSSSHDSAIKAQETQTSFKLYGPSASDCSKVSCPSQEDLEKLARKGTTVMKVAGGDVALVTDVFASIPKPMIEARAPQNGDVVSTSAAEADVLTKTPDFLTDNFKTGPLSDGSIQADIAGVDTEFMPDLEPEFEPEFASSIDDAAIVLEDLSSSSIDALNSAL